MTLERFQDKWTSGLQLVTFLIWVPPRDSDVNQIFF